MATSVVQALSAYRQAALDLGQGIAARPDEGPSFADLLGSAAKDSVAVGRGAEQLTQAVVAGKADLSSVIAAVANAELTLQTVVAVRDRMVQAYQEIMRMPI